MKKLNQTTGEEVLTFIADKAAEILKAKGINRQVVAALSVEIADGIQAEFGGQAVYFKKGAAEDSTERRLSLVADYESGLFTAGELARKYGVSIQTVYRYIREHGKGGHESHT